VFECVLVVVVHILFAIKVVTVRFI
jgi:hypothetical protein